MRSSDFPVRELRFQQVMRLSFYAWFRLSVLSRKFIFRPPFFVAFFNSPDELLFPVPFANCPLVFILVCLLPFLQFPPPPSDQVLILNR